MNRLSLLLAMGLAACQADSPPEGSSGASTGDYLGQTPPEMTAQRFAPEFVSTEHGELNSVFSPDLQEFYFSRRGIPGRRSTIMVTRRGAEGWAHPEVVDFGERYNAIDLFITPDGERMVFCSNRPHPGESQPQSDHDLWVSERDGGGWGAPVLFAPAALSSSEEFYPIVTASGNLYFNSQREGPGTNNIFRAPFVYVQNCGRSRRDSIVRIRLEDLAVETARPGRQSHVLCDAGASEIQIQGVLTTTDHELAERFKLVERFVEPVK